MCDSACPSVAEMQSQGAPVDNDVDNVVESLGTKKPIDKRIVNHVDNALAMATATNRWRVALEGEQVAQLKEIPGVRVQTLALGLFAVTATPDIGPMLARRFGWAQAGELVTEPRYSIELDDDMIDHAKLQQCIETRQPAPPAT